MITVLASLDYFFQLTLSRICTDWFSIRKTVTDLDQPWRTCQANVSSILSKNKLLRQLYSIKSDQTLQEHKKNSAFMKERWALLQLGFNRKSIKVRNLSIYVKNVLHGKLDSSDYRPQYPSSNVIPITWIFCPSTLPQHPTRSITLF